MASIQLKDLSNNTKLENKPYTYVDLHLDIQQINKGIGGATMIKGKDIQVSYDYEAIRNSIFNILNTRPMQRILLPEFGCNLLGYVGRPVTVRAAEEIGRVIYNSIRIYEPRVVIDDILVVAKPDQNEYDVTITVTLPDLKKKNLKIIGTLTKFGILESNIQ